MDDPPVRHSAARTRPDVWVDPDDDPRQTGEPLHAERDVLVDYLRAYRLTLRMKCEGLTAEQLAARSVPPSTMSLLGLVRHLAGVEHHWFAQVMAGLDTPRPFAATDRRDVDFDGATADPDLVDEAWRVWRDEVAFARRFVDEAADLGVADPKGEITLREVLVHMIEEYARHAGHADLLRERIDGRVGQ